MYKIAPFTYFPKSNCVTGWSRQRPEKLGNHIVKCEAHIEKCENIMKVMRAEIAALRSLNHTSIPNDDSISILKHEMDLLRDQFVRYKRQKEFDPDNAWNLNVINNSDQNLEHNRVDLPLKRPRREDGDDSIVSNFEDQWIKRQRQEGSMNLHSDYSISMLDIDDSDQNLEHISVEIPLKRRHWDDDDDSPLPGNDDSPFPLGIDDTIMASDSTRKQSPVPTISLNPPTEVSSMCLREAMALPLSDSSQIRNISENPKVCCICREANKYLPGRGAVPRHRDVILLIRADQGTKQSDLLKQNFNFEINGVFHCHASCLKNFCRPVYIPESTAAKSIWQSEAFTSFLDEDVGNKIVVQGYCTSLTKLKDSFSARLRNIGQHDDNNRSIDSHYLKKKILESKYGSKLTFLTPMNATLSEVVVNIGARNNLADYYHALDSFLPTNVDGSGDDDGSDEDDSDYDDNDNDIGDGDRTYAWDVEDNIDFFNMAVKLRHLIKETNRSRKVKISDTPRPWEFEEETIEKFIPPWLFNLLAVITNSVSKSSSNRKSDFVLDNPHLLQSDAGSYVPVNDSNKAKIRSLAQDLLFLYSKGRCFTPKHVGLAVWQWHKYKTSLDIDVLHALGHCISYSAIMTIVDLSASDQQSQENALPVGILKCIQCCIAADNLDFRNETLSGAGQTHLLSSIFTQYVTEEVGRTSQVQNNIVATAESSARRTKRKRFEPNNEEIVPCGKGKKSIQPFEVGPDGLTPHERRNDGEDLSDSEKGKILMRNYSLLDILTTLVKCSFRELNIPFILPDWIGCNMWMNPRRPEAIESAEGGAVLKPCTVAYGPIINADPNAPATLNHFLKKVVAAKTECGIQEVALTADMSLYEKFLPIINEKSEYSSIMLMVGDMHMDMSFFCIMGKCFKGSCYDTIAIRANLVAEGSMPQVISGKHVNRATRTHETMGEVLECMRFKNWVDRKFDSADDKERIYHLLAKVVINDSSPEELTPEDFVHNLPNVRKVIFEIDYNNEVLKIMDDYMDWVNDQCINDPTFAFWSLMIDLINLIKLHARAVKSSTSNDFMWLLYVETVSAMLPYFHYYNQTHYRRYLSWFVICLKFLKEKRPMIYNSFMEGKYAVRRNNHNNFSDCPMDQTLEHGPNRDAKVSGGIGQGRNQRSGETERWAASLPNISQISRNFYNNIAGLSQVSRTSKHLDGPQIIQHENFVKEILSIFALEMVHDPFSGNTELINICSGEIAPEAVARSYKECKRIGSEADAKITSERWLLRRDNQENIPIDASIAKIKNHTWSIPNIPRNRLRFAGHGKPENITIAKLPVDEQFSQAIALACVLLLSDDPQEQISTISNKLTKEELMSYPLCSYPASISCSNGLFNQGSKSDLRQRLINHAGDNADVTTNESQMRELWFSRNGVFVVDAMAVVTPLAVRGKTASSPKTFRELAFQILMNMVISSKNSGCSILHIVTDTYNPGSTKLMEHKARKGKNTHTRMLILRGENAQQKLPQSQDAMKAYMACDENKNDLIEFIFETACKVENFSNLNRMHGHPSGLEVFITHGELCHRICQDTTVTPMILHIDEIPDLRSDHGEADGRLILHSLYAARHLPTPSASASPRIIIQSEDTDTLVIALCHSNTIATALRTTVDDAIGTFCMHLRKGDPRLVDIFSIAFILGPDLCAALPGLHAVTGCDTTSFFKGIGKLPAWKIFLQNNRSYTRALTAVGSTRMLLPEVVMDDLEAFVCRCYQAKSTPSAQVLRKVNDLRVRLFTTTTGLKTDVSLPPTRDCLHCHFQRANFQALQWRLSDQTHMRLPHATDFGFRSNDGQLSIVWFTGNMLPQSLQTPISCSCKKSKCTSGRCACRKLNLHCNSNCKCCGCENHAACAGEDAIELEDEQEGEEEEEGNDVDSDNPDSEDDNDSIL